MEQLEDLVVEDQQEVQDHLVVQELLDKVIQEVLVEQQELELVVEQGQVKLDLEDLTVQVMAKVEQEEMVYLFQLVQPLDVQEHQDPHQEDFLQVVEVVEEIEVPLLYQVVVEQVVEDKVELPLQLVQ